MKEGAPLPGGSTEKPAPVKVETPAPTAASNQELIDYARYLIVQVQRGQVSPEQVDGIFQETLENLRRRGASTIDLLMEYAEVTTPSATTRGLGDEPDIEGMATERLRGTPEGQGVLEREQRREFEKAFGREPSARDWALWKALKGDPVSGRPPTSDEGFAEMYQRGLDRPQTRMEGVEDFYRRRATLSRPPGARRHEGPVAPAPPRSGQDPQTMEGLVEHRAWPLAAPTYGAYRFTQYAVPELTEEQRQAKSESELRTRAYLTGGVRGRSAVERVLATGGSGEGYEGLAERAEEALEQARLENIAIARKRSPLQAALARRPVEAGSSFKTTDWLQRTYGGGASLPRFRR